MGEALLTRSSGGLLSSGKVGTGELVWSDSYTLNHMSTDYTSTNITDYTMYAGVYDGTAGIYRIELDISSYTTHATDYPYYVNIFVGDRALYYNTIKVLDGEFDAMSVQAIGIYKYLDDPSVNYPDSVRIQYSTGADIIGLTVNARLYKVA